MFLAPGHKIRDRYVIKQALGSGAFGTVYLAYDPVMTRQVAIKELAHAWLPDETVKARFINEARAMGNLDDANVVPVHDLIEPQEGSEDSYYIIMKYMIGGSLAELLKRHRILAIRDSLQITIGMCKALAKAHRLGIVHRDVKPDNILLGDGLEARLGDFGLAQIPGFILSKGGQYGTLFWMSVEQAQAMQSSLSHLSVSDRPETPLDGRSDLYSLTAVLYTMLTGQRYLDFESCVSKARDAAHSEDDEERVRGLIYRRVCDAIIRDYPERPSALRPEIPSQLDVLVLKGLAKRREHRFAAAGEMASQLDAILRLPAAYTQDTRLQQAAKLLSEDSSEEASRIVRQVLSEYPDSLAALELMGDIAYSCRDYSTAVESWEKAKRLSPDCCGLYSKLGSLYSRLSLFDRAVEAFGKGLDLRPDDPFLCYGLATALWNAGQLQEAIEALSTACKLLPDSRKEALLSSWSHQVKGSKGI